MTVDLTRARDTLMAALALITAADPDGTQKYLTSAAKALQDTLDRTNADIAIDAGPVRVGDRVRIPGGAGAIQGVVLGGLGNFIPDLVPVQTHWGSQVVPVEDVDVLADRDGNEPGERPATWPETAS